ncbi:hypothetical protein B484DRAFT_426708 [Ochromonadaceae sp. CCMP2298]|nr:hypothetical protein B484DRAFT_426708 [Ochromonadaceae sp. CCMP2298]
MDPPNPTPPLGEYFQSLDKDFEGFKSTADEVFVYNATDVLVQSTWELPIVVQYPDSTVHYQFCASPGSITFGVVFVAAPEEEQDLSDLEIETVEDMQMVNSDLDAVTGSFEVPCEGVVFFMWDNTFDWSANKQISYTIEVKQPAFAHNDQLRVDSASADMPPLLEELQSCLVRRADAQDSIEHTQADVAFLQEQLSDLQLLLEQKQTEQRALQLEVVGAKETVGLKDILLQGLCVRTLDRAILSHVLSYLRPGVARVCRRCPRNSHRPRVCV